MQKDFLLKRRGEGGTLEFIKSCAGGDIVMNKSLLHSPLKGSRLAFIKHVLCGKHRIRRVVYALQTLHCTDVTVQLCTGLV